MIPGFPANAAPRARCRAGWLLVGAALLLPASTLADGEQEDPRVLLQRMATSVETLNYEGTLVHIVEGRAGPMYVGHRV